MVHTTTTYPHSSHVALSYCNSVSVNISKHYKKKHYHYFGWWYSFSVIAGRTWWTLPPLIETRHVTLKVPLLIKDFEYFSVRRRLRVVDGLSWIYICMSMYIDFGDQSNVLKQFIYMRKCQDLPCVPILPPGWYKEFRLNPLFQHFKYWWYHSKFVLKLFVQMSHTQIHCIIHRDLHIWICLCPLCNQYSLVGLISISPVMNN